MTSRQKTLVCSWLLMLISLYVAFVVDITIALIVAVPVIFFRDIRQEKKFTAIFVEEKNSLFQKAKYYSMILSIVMLIVVLYLLFKEDSKYLKDYKLIGKLLTVVLWPFLALGIYHDLLLFKEYRNLKINKRS